MIYLSKEERYITLGFINVILLLLSILLFNNDIINYFIIFFILTLISFIYLIYNVFSKDDSKSLYNRKLRKILKTYDSIIIHTNENISFLSNNLIFVKDFKDLVVAHLELNKMIMYIEEDKSSIFLLQDYNIMYIYILKMNDDIISNYESILRSKIKNKLFLVNKV